MSEQKAGRTDVVDPTTGEAMVLDARYSAKAAYDRVARNTANPEGARRVVEAIADKEEEHGRLYVNPRTGYQMRVTDDEDLSQRANDQAARGGGGSADEARRLASR